MDGMILLKEARAAGLMVALEGDVLKTRGPKRADPIARKLLAHKLEVQRALGATKFPATKPDETPSPLSPVRRWDSEARELIAFFQSARSQLPQSPFRLTRWQYISDPVRWYRSLEVDIAFGPLGCRARMGALQEDLRRLREYILRKGL